MPGKVKGVLEHFCAAKSRGFDIIHVMYFNVFLSMLWCKKQRKIMSKNEPFGQGQPSVSSMRQEALERVSQQYDFGPDVVVEDFSGWEQCGDECSRPVFVRHIESDESAPTEKVTLAVRFYPGSPGMSDVYAIDEKGQMLGYLKGNAQGYDIEGGKKALDGFAKIALAPTEIPFQLKPSAYVCRGMKDLESAKAYAVQAQEFFAKNDLPGQVFVVKGPTSTTKSPFEVVTATAGYTVVFSVGAVPRTIDNRSTHSGTSPSTPAEQCC
jgi:hypothetical protein